MTNPTDTFKNEELKAIRDVVSEHVFTKIPIRMLRFFRMGANDSGLSNVELIDRNAVINDIVKDIQGDAQVRPKIITGLRNAPDGGESARAIIRHHAEAKAGYAILSHAWFESEVLFNDICNTGWQTNTLLQTKKSAGYAKLEGFCKIARGNHGARYGWLDTACIDKSSTSELDESIRSMYRWYLNSAICIVYLAETSSLEVMEHDRWFTRGWTLQEYLAPIAIKFYSQKWSPLSDGMNDKYPERERSQTTLLQDKINLATGIPPFTGPPPERYHTSPSGSLSCGRIIKQMQWAARRNTTREEDRSYSLMGIFNVSFSIAYGEGGERAFFRLLEAILATKPAHQVCELLVWGGRPMSDDIHTSRMLPSSAACYGTPDATIPAWITTSPASMILLEPTVLTHIGLRARMLLVPVNLVRAEDAVHPFDGHRVGFAVAGAAALKFHPLDVHLQARYGTYPSAKEIYPPLFPNDSQSGPRFMLAIYTFSEGADVVRVPAAGLGFILGWHPPPLAPWIKDANQASVYLNARSRIETKRPVMFQRTVNRTDGYNEVSKTAGAMQAVGIILVSLYL